MKNFIKFLFFVLLLGISTSRAAIANNYSTRAIQVYNIGASYQNQGKYELAEKQYKLALSIQPDFQEAKNNLAVIYETLANDAYNEGDYFNALSSSRKSTEFKSNNANAYAIMGNSYTKLNKNNEAIIAYKKALSLKANDINLMHALAQSYLASNQSEKASPIYKKLLSLDPNDTAAIQNSKYIDSKREDNNLASSLENIQTSEKAPSAIYSLIRPEKGVPLDTIENTKIMLDLIWNDPTGKILINNLITAKIPINLTMHIATDANATKTDKKNTLYLYGCIPVITLKQSKVVINIPYMYVNNFYNPNLSPFQRILCLHTFVHEFCHAYRDIKFPQATNSIEEELGASMIGLNISYKVLTGNYLTYDQTKTHSLNVLKSIYSDSHRELPTYSGFINNMQTKWIEFPHPELYRDIPSMRRWNN